MTRRLMMCLLIAVSVGAWNAVHADASSFKITKETVDGGIKESRFEITVAGQTVPGILWTPNNAEGTRPLVLFGHGGTQHKRVDNILRNARDLVTTEYYAVAAIDAPGHGERVSASGTGSSRADFARLMANANTTAEWQATIDALQKLDNVGTGPIGYWGVSMGTRFGVPLVSEEPRIKAAILGLFGLFPEGEGSMVNNGFAEQAASIQIPLMFVFQWDDQLMTREQGLAMYDKFGSQDKVMHINPGGHTGIPAAETETWKPFFVRHLGKAQLK